MKTFADYEKAVIEDYRMKKKNEGLSLILDNPTPASLRDECLAVCQERYDKRDDRALRTFFGPAADKEAFLKAIDGFETDKFRPLVNYLKKGTKSPEPKNVELLAWLINFQPRPVDRFKEGVEHLTVPKKDTKEDVVVPEDENEIGGDEPTVESYEPGKRVFNFNLGKAAVVISLLTVVVVGIRFCNTKANKSLDVVLPTLSGKEACMFWDRDHYEQVSCGYKMENILVIALDSEKLVHFRKITQQDTITGRSRGSVWYVKYNGDIEFYTSDGFHPIDQRLRLKPITDYIVRKYIHPSQ